MTPEGKGADYADGVSFEYKADGLAWGPCRHRFFASDGNTVVATRLEAGPTEGEDPDWNYAPELHDASVEPWDGSPADEFVFQVIYVDEEGLPSTYTSCSTTRSMRWSCRKGPPPTGSPTRSRLRGCPGATLAQFCGLRRNKRLCDGPRAGAACPRTGP